MAYHRLRRPYRLIGFKAYFDDDQPIIDWWDSLNEGSRSEAIRELIHEALGLKPRKTDSELVELRQETRWIRQTLDGIPLVLERLVNHATALQPGGLRDSVRAQDPGTSQLDDTESQRRAGKLQRAGW